MVADNYLLVAYNLLSLLLLAQIYDAIEWIISFIYGFWLTANFPSSHM